MTEPVYIKEINNSNSSLDMSVKIIEAASSDASSHVVGTPFRMSSKNLLEHAKTLR